ncbi:MAG: GDP-mannose 4,6-dehydratase [Flavobacteriia bacterium]|nr:GDP-mannose 4,6-dehydratase [Flavobacteriia bacterium]
MKKKVALIFGVTGQDGSLLARLLIKKGYIVHGIKRRSSSFNTARIDDLYNTYSPKEIFFLHYGDLTDSLNVFNHIKEIRPDEIYNLGAQSHVKVSFETPEYTQNSDAAGVLRILEAIRINNLQTKTRFYQASTSEMFGMSKSPQNEKTLFQPVSPYGTSKLFGYWIVRNYRTAYNMFASNGILFNHEGPFRGETFVSKKITMAVAKIFYGQQKILYLGNLNAKRDWGDARDYVEGMWKILQYKKPNDFVLATGKSYSVRTFTEEAFKCVGIQIIWKGKKDKEVGIDKKTGKILVRIDKNYFRPNEVDDLRGDYSKAKKLLNWKPKISFKQMVREMVNFDLEASKKI